MKKNVYLKYEPLNSHIIACALPNSRRLDGKYSANNANMAIYFLHNSLCGNDLWCRVSNESKNRRNKCNGKRERLEKFPEVRDARYFKINEANRHSHCLRVCRNSYFYSAYRSGKRLYETSVPKRLLYSSNWSIHRKKPSKALMPFLIRGAA